MPNGVRLVSACIIFSAVSLSPWAHRSLAVAGGRADENSFASAPRTHYLDRHARLHDERRSHRSIVASNPAADPSSENLPTQQTAGVWSPLGSGLNATATCITTLGADVYVGGYFTSAGGVTANGVARWDGSTWHPLGTGLSGASPNAYALDTSGSSIVVGGYFLRAGGIDANSVARWTGTVWEPLGGGVLSTGQTLGTVAAVAAQGSFIYAGGSFVEAGGMPARNIARWDGVSWSPLGAGVNGTVYAILAVGTDVYAGGAFDSAGTKRVNYIARWNGTDWDSLGSGMDFYVYTLALRGSDLCAGGVFTAAGDQPAAYVANWDGSQWSAVGSGVDNIVYSLSASADGLYAGGIFAVAGGQPVNRVAKWTGASWEPLAGGVNNVVFAVRVADDVNLHCGGAFTIADAQPAARIARWFEQGSSVTALGAGWNLVSVPRIPLSYDVSDLFPGRTGTAFEFVNATQSYAPVTTMANGQGYWVKYPSAITVTITGQRPDSLKVEAAAAGWVLLGSLTDQRALSSLVTTPSGSITGTIFRWNRSLQSYEPASALVPAEGHWVKVSRACTIEVR